jgi:hypothetical protein
MGGDTWNTGHHITNGITNKFKSLQSPRQVKGHKKRSGKMARRTPKRTLMAATINEQ